MRLFKLMKVLYRKVFSKLFPDRYLRKIGLNFQKGELYLYGRVYWGTEPWIIKLGSNIHITEGCRFITHDGGTLLFRHIVPDLEITKPITLGNNVYLGNNTIVLPGVNIGNNVVIGAGSVVAKDIPDNTVAAGVPARFIKSTDEYFEKLKNESLHLGHLKGKEKDKALREYYDFKDTTKGGF